VDGDIQCHFLRCAKSQQEIEIYAFPLHGCMAIKQAGDSLSRNEIGDRTDAAARNKANVFGEDARAIARFRRLPRGVAPFELFFWNV
jgi:hypothetical protein